VDNTGQRAPASGSRDERRANALARSQAGRRSSRRAQPQERFGRFLGLTALGSLIPGTGLLAAGRRGWGRFVLTVLGLGVLALGLIAWRVPRRQLAISGFDQDVLTIVVVSLVVIATGWLAVAVASHRALEPAGLSNGRRFAGALVVIVSASLVVSPMALAAKYAWTQHDLLGALSGRSSTAPDIDKENPWEDRPRVNVLLMGSDAGEGRIGVRPDTLILASIDTDTGDTVMFSLPRNLQNVPFPEDTALYERFPSGFAGGPGEDVREYLINAVYNNAPVLVGEEAFAGSDDPGADATKLAVSGVLGVDVDYYVMANLDGFEDIINAMGGITIDVPYPIPIGTRVANAGEYHDGSNCRPTRSTGSEKYPDGRWILPGDDVQLTGGEALWFARARCAPFHPDFPESTGSNSPITMEADYSRMDRQRCVMSAIAQRAEPLTLLANFESLAAATEQNVATDIPADLWPAFADLGLKVQGANIESLPFTADVISPSDPDYTEIHALVEEALEPAPDLGTAAETSSGSSPDGDADDESGDDGGSPDDTEGGDASEEPVGDGTGADEGAGDAEPSETESTEAVDVTATC
jgi:anionic cell wall polymer biosynthesis LytR-Cps2A-Psr (LCP) family protein